MAAGRGDAETFQIIERRQPSRPRFLMPGAFIQGTEHCPSLSRASDVSVSTAYSALDPLVSRNEQATESPFSTGLAVHAVVAAQEISRILERVVRAQ